MSVLELRDVSVEYQRRGSRPVRAVAGVSLALEPGTVSGLVGESGCGKSTLARAATGLVPLASGEVLFEGRPIAALSRLRRRSRAELGLQMVFQDPYSSLNPRRRIREQLTDSLRVAGVDESRWPERIEELLDQVGLPATAAADYPHEFSGGQRQRLCIARVLAVEPSVIVADEPISALDASTQASVAKLLLRLSRELGVSILFISHDLSIVREIADDVTVMYLGRVVERGPSARLWEAPQHPYSEALIGAVPRADGTGRLPVFLEGEVPDPAAPPSGCRFHPRCPIAVERCAVEDPALTQVGDAHSAACLLRQGVAAP
jgi:peptide/nickel transport system ATP-binding protein